MKKKFTLSDRYRLLFRLLSHKDNELMFDKDEKVFIVFRCYGDDNRMQR